MSGRDDPVGGGMREPAVNQPWFQVFWRLMAALIAISTVLLVLRACRFYRKYKYPQTQVRRDPNMYLSNPQANRLWGNAPGVIVAGANADNVYRNADRVGNFGASQPTLPELEEARSDLKGRAPHPQENSIIVATRLDDDKNGLNEDSDIPEALPYVDDTRRYQEGIV